MRCGTLKPRPFELAAAAPAGAPTDLARVHQDFLRDVLPYATGNVHPGFMGWVHGGGTAVGMLADMEQLGRTISHTCQIARYLETRIAAEPRLELLAPVPLNIVCFRYRGDNPDELNTGIVADVQESGVAAPSTTRIDGRVAIRAATFNHRTAESDIDALIKAVLDHGNSRSPPAPTPTA